MSEYYRKLGDWKDDPGVPWQGEYGVIIKIVDRSECGKPCGCKWANGPCVLKKGHECLAHYCEECIQP